MSTELFMGNPLRVKREWLTLPQIVVYLAGFVAGFGLTNQIGSPYGLLLAPLVILLAAPLGPKGRMVVFWPLHLVKRRGIRRRKNSINKIILDDEPDTGRVPKGGFNDAFHGAVVYRSGDGTTEDRLPVLLDHTKQFGALIVTATGLRVGAGGSQEAREATAEEISNGIRDTINGHGGKLSIAELRIKRPGNVYAATGYVEAEMADAVREAEASTPLSRVREYATDRAWDGMFDETSRLWVVNSDLENTLRHYTVETLLADSPSRRRPLSSQQVFSSRLWNAAETLEQTLEHVGAQSPEIADAARQIDLLGRCFDVHPDDLEACYRRVQHDTEEVRLEGSLDLTKSLLVQRGAFPRSVWAGHDYLLTGRSYHRVLHVLGGRGNSFPAHLSEFVVANARYPIIFSSVCVSDTGRIAVIKQEEAARLEELRLDQRTQGYKNVPARYQEGLEKAAAERDNTFYSRSAPLKISTFFIVSAVSLDDLNRFETDARNLLNRGRVDVETITGEEEQLPFFLYALNLRRL